MYDLERITKEVNEACGKAGIKVNIPVKLNGRLSSTLGEVKFIRECGKCTPTSLEISKSLLGYATDDTIHDVILHECAHLIVLERTHEDHGHDAYFKKVCAEIGTANDTVSTDVHRQVNAKPMFKYGVSCKECGKQYRGYARKCRTLKDIIDGFCTCTECGSNQFIITENW